MTIARVTNRDCSATAATTSVTATFATGATTSGHLLVAAVLSTGVGAGTNAMSGWTVASDTPLATTSCDLTVFWKLSTGDTTAVATAAGAATMTIHAYEYSGAATVSPVETSNNATSGTGTTTRATNTITTTNAGDLIFVCCGQTGTNGGTTAWATATILQADATSKLIAGQYLPGTTVTTFQDTASWTTSRVNAAIIAAFTPAPPPTGTPGLLAFT